MTVHKSRMHLEEKEVGTMYDDEIIDLLEIYSPEESWLLYKTMLKEAIDRGIKRDVKDARKYINRDIYVCIAEPEEHRFRIEYLDGEEPTGMSCAQCDSPVEKIEEFYHE